MQRRPGSLRGAARPGSLPARRVGVYRPPVGQLPVGRAPPYPASTPDISPPPPTTLPSPGRGAFPRLGPSPQQQPPGAQRFPPLRGAPSGPEGPIPLPSMTPPNRQVRRSAPRQTLREPSSPPRRSTPPHTHPGEVLLPHPRPRHPRPLLQNPPPPLLPVAAASPSPRRLRSAACLALCFLPRAGRESGSPPPPPPHTH